MPATKTKAAEIGLTKQDLEEARQKLQEIKSKQDKLRESELAIREWLAEKIHDGEEGAKSIKLDGITCTVTRVLNYTVGKDEAERMTTEQSALALEALRWKAEIRVGVFKKNREILSEYVVVKPGPPTVEIK